jgi:hypothetical protein
VIGQTELPDEAWQLAVLSHVLVLHPAHLSADELRREMLADRHDFTQSDLVAWGLLRREGDSVIPTRAAVSFHELHG